MNSIADCVQPNLPCFPELSVRIDKQKSEGGTKASNPKTRRISGENNHTSLSQDDFGVTGLVNAVSAEIDVSKAIASAIVREDWEAVREKAKLLLELRPLLDRCDPTLDNTLELSVAIYVYRVLAAAGLDRDANPIMLYIARSPLLDRVISRILHIENLPENGLIEDEIRDQLVLLLCHENFARRWWQGRSVYYDPTKNTLHGWVSNQVVRRALINFRALDHFYGTQRSQDMASITDGDEEDPLTASLTEEEEADSIFDTASLNSLGCYLQMLIQQYGIDDTRRAIRAVLRYQARSAPRLFERKGLMIKTLAVIQAMHPALSLQIVRIDVDHQMLSQAAGLARSILNDKLESLSESADISLVYAWVSGVRPVHHAFRDAVREFDQSRVVNGKRVVPQILVDNLRRMVGQILVDRLEVLAPGCSRKN